MEESVVEKYPIVFFYITVLAIGFIAIIPVIFFGIGIFTLISATSASLGAIIFVGITKGKEGLKDLFSTFKNWRCNPVWYIISIFLMPGVTLLTMGISIMLGIPLRSGLTLTPPPMRNLELLILQFIFIFFQAGLGEEIGWRIYATPKLAEKYSKLKAALIIGALWAFWHTPQFLFPGTIQNRVSIEVGFLIAYPVYMLFVTLSAILFSWVYFQSDGNAWLPVLLHTTLNTAHWLLLPEAPFMVVMIFTVIIWILSVSVAVVYGADLSRKFKD
ncbi:MAG: CPBP family intramembrane metalloprotease [Candidatus Helarchaeota archaeon]|nr:CPBP family intramembrane metalloprotease [Candidatus Helarchaeota archaeon]